MSVLNNFKIGIVAVSLLIAAMAWVTNADAEHKDFSKMADKSDLNSDELVDLEDLILFSANYLERNWETVDWCLFYNNTITHQDFDGRSTAYYLKHFRLLLTFIRDFNDCDADPGPDPDPDPDPMPPLLTLENQPKHLIRLAAARDSSGNYYFTDVKVGSLYIYDSGLALIGELKGLDKPLGVAVNAQGHIFVGNDGRDNIEVYDPADGNLLAIFGEGLLLMPTAITFDPDGNIYVTDSRSHNVRVFDAAYNPVRTIGSAGEGDNELNFPVDTEIITSYDGNTVIHEVFVADQGNHRIQIFDTSGNSLSSINPGDCGWFGGCDPPALNRLQALSVDSLGRLHALDLFETTVSIFNPVSGEYLGAYGEHGNRSGQLSLPMDIFINPTDQVIVTAGNGNRIEVLAIP